MKRTSIGKPDEFALSAQQLVAAKAPKVPIRSLLAEQDEALRILTQFGAGGAIPDRAH